MEFTILELAEKVIEMTGSKSKISFLPLPQDDPVQRKPDISLAGEILDGWKPGDGAGSGTGENNCLF